MILQLFPFHSSLKLAFPSIFSIIRRVAHTANHPDAIIFLMDWGGHSKAPERLIYKKNYLIWIRNTFKSFFFSSQIP